MRSEEGYDTGEMNSKVFLTMFYTLLFMAMLGLCGCGGGGGGGTSNPSTAKILASTVVQPANNVMAVGKTQQFTILRTYSDGTTYTDLSAAVTWSSSSTSVATINTAGVASAIAAGQTTITATVDGVPYTTTLSVPATTLVAIAITPSTQSQAIGTAQQFTATGAYSDGTFQDLTATASWSSATTTVATIAAGGKATAVGAGSTTITATSGSKFGTAALTVSPASVTLVSIAVTPANPGIVVGTSQQFIATGTFSNSTTQDLTSTVTWSSSAPSIATITQTGKASSVAAGSTTITAALGGKSGTTVLNVTAAAAATLQSIAVTPTSQTIAAGSTQQFSATGTFSNSATQDLTTQVTWSSSDNLIASITPNGKITALSEGTTTITASFGGKSGSQSLTVTHAVLSGTWEGTYLIYDAVDKSQLGPYSFKMVLDQSGANVTGTASLRYKDAGQVPAIGPLTVESVIVGREITLVFTYIDTRYSREMVDRGTATITDASMHGVIIENYNGGYNCSYSFDLKKL